MTFATPSPVISTVAVLVPAALLGGLLVVGLRSLRGTTLVAPWGWSIAALVVIVAVELLAIGAATEQPAGWLPAARYVAAMGTFCPLMAVLGAKRPQDRAWQIIVLSLWGVLALPAIQDVLYHYGQPVSLDSAWRWFLAILIGVVLVNYLPTRYWPASVFYAAAQIVLLAELLPFPSAPLIEPGWRVPVALALFAAAGAIVSVGWPRPRPATDTLDRLQRDFRDAYGLLWGVRIRERAQEPAGRSPLAQSRAAEERAFATHLQRFVSRAWVDSRTLPAPAEQQGAAP